jgi:NlpC/P60 family putative phage cell wall peptidase
VIASLRAAVLAEAETWLGTPYHHMARVKGAGCDCLTLLAEVYERAGILPHVEVPYYRPDFMHHRSDERYLEGVLGYGREVEQPEPGDVALFKLGRVFAHAGIVVEWPRLIHAYGMPPRGKVDWGNGEQGDLARYRPVKFISPFSDPSFLIPDP